MFRRTAFALLTIAALVVATASLAVAQIATPVLPTPVAKGSGAIQVGSNFGLFDFSVFRCGKVPTGFIRYREVASNGSTPVCVIVARTIRRIDVSGNFATIVADGYWGNMASTITIECLDDNPCGDWLHIRAVPTNSPLTVLYDAAGGVVRGDVTIPGAPVFYGAARGEGAISTVRPNTGKFAFSAKWTSAGISGTLHYVDYNPLLASATARPRAVIDLPVVQTLKFDGNVAYLSGKGLLNGRPVFIEVKAIDNQMWPTFVFQPDEFYITAKALATDTTAAGYRAGGKLISGDITIALPVDKASQ